MDLDLVVSNCELPTEDDPGAEQFYHQRCVGGTNVVVPCRWGLLDNVKTRQDVRDLVNSTLIGLQSLAILCFGGKFPYLFNEFGWPRIGWDMDFSKGTVEDYFAVVSPICKLAMYFIRTFGQLAVRFGRSEAVNLVDGTVTGEDGMSRIVGLLLQYLMYGKVTVADLIDGEINARKVILGENDIIIEDEATIKCNRALQSRDLCLSDVVLTKRPNIPLPSKPIKMLKLAVQGYVWRTDPETSSILKAVSGTRGELVGKWEPLTRYERGQMLDAIDVNGHFRVVGTGVMVQRNWGRQTLVRREEFYERVQSKPSPRLGFTCMLTCEQDALTSRIVELLTWMRDRPQEWAEDLFKDLTCLKKAGFKAESEEISRAIEAARVKAAIRHGNDDECFDMLFGPINTGYSFACESTDVSSFAKLHYRRCLRIIGACTSVDGIPLYELESLHRLDTRTESIVRDVSRLEPIVNELRGRSTPLLHRPWKTEMW